MNHPPNSQDWQDTLSQKNKRHSSPQKCAFGIMLTHEQTHTHTHTHTHKMHPISRFPSPETQTQIVPGIEGKEPAFPSIPMEREKRRVVRHPQRFDQSGKSRKPKMRPICQPRSTRTAFGHTDTPVHETARGVFLEEQLVARCDPDFSRVKEIRKNKSLRS